MTANLTFGFDAPAHQHTFAMCVHGQLWHAACVDRNCPDQHWAEDPDLRPMVFATESPFTRRAREAKLPAAAVNSGIAL